MRVKISSEIGEQYLETKLLVGADGGRSQVRQLANIKITERQYEQTCIVTTIKSERSHQNFAYERFQASGPFAILPLSSDRACIVWTATKEETPALLALDEATFLQELIKRCGAPLIEKLGKVTLESCDRANYVPRWMHSKTFTGKLLNAISLNKPNLIGLPLAIIDSLAKRLRRILGINRFSISSDHVLAESPFDIKK